MKSQQIILERDLEEYVLEHIPISAAMGVKVETASPQTIILRASFANNINHKKTVFGGSLHAVATLACWSLLHVNLMEEATQIVIASSEVKYLAPVLQDFKAECNRPDKETWEYFLKTLTKKRKARIGLQAQIFQEGKLCVDYSGIFVAIKTG